MGVHVGAGPVDRGKPGSKLHLVCQVADRPAWDRVVDPAGAPPLAGGAGAVVAELLAAAAGPLGLGLGAVVALVLLACALTCIQRR
jgi:hypothetical protein